MTRHLISLFALFTLVPIATVLLLEWNKHVLIWHFRIVDFVDLVVLAPFYAAILFAIHVTLFGRSNQTATLHAVSLGCIAVFLYGHAMHITANSINTFATEVNDYRERIPNDMYDLIYFLDETLSHYLIFVALFALLLLWGRLPFAIDVLSSRERQVMLGLGFFQGSGQAIAMVEARKAALAIGLALGTWVYIAWHHRAAAGQTAMQQYIRGMAIALVLTLIIYVIVIGDFTSPSDLY